METTETKPLPGQETADHVKKLQLRLEGLESDKRNLEKHLAIVADALLAEAIERDWCDEYNDFVHCVNEKARADVLEKVKKSYSRTFDVRVDVETSQTASDIWQGIENAISEYCDYEGIEVFL